MKYQAIGINPDKTVTVRLFVGDKVYDEIFPLPTLPTVEDLINQMAEARIEEIRQNPPTKAELEDPEIKTYEVKGVAKEELENG